MLLWVFLLSTGLQPTNLGGAQWTVTPQAMFPSPAITAGVTEGSVNLRCQPTSDGHLEDCVVVSETPEGFGFGQAALASTTTARLNPSSGPTPRPVVNFNIRFVIEGDLGPVRESDVTLDCEILQSGAVRDCRIVRANAAGERLGQRLLANPAALATRPPPNWQSGQRTNIDFYEQDPRVPSD